MLQRDQHLLALLPPRYVLERAVVEDVAVLEDLDERRATMGVRGSEHLDHVLAGEVVRPPNEGRLCAQRHAERVERPVDAAEWRRLRDLAELGGRRILPL